MPRWEPDAAQRLVIAAVELFADQGYDNTTVVQIAERAGLTKSTFFRYFKDKREVLFEPDEMAGVIARGIASAPSGTAPMDAVAHALDAVGTEAFTIDRREFSARRRAVISANPELQEREALKGLALTAAMAHALRRRGVPELEAAIAAQLGLFVMDAAYREWAGAPATLDFAAVARRKLDDVRAANPFD